MNDEMNYLLKLRFGKDKTVEAFFLDDSDRVDARQAAMRIVGTLPEEQIGDVFDYLSEVVAELVAMTDNTDDALNTLYGLTRSRIREFNEYRESLGRFNNSKKLLKNLS